MMHSFIRAVSVLSFFLILSATAARAEAPFGVSLMRPDSLAGWEYGEAPIKGWAMVDGRLSGSADATPLLSGFTAGDFELRFHWSVAGGGALRLLLPEVPQGKGLELVLDESAGCGRLTDGDRELAPGAKVEPLPDKPHTAALRRMLGKLSLAVLRPVSHA
jgi:hypothetical protein